MKAVIPGIVWAIWQDGSVPQLGNPARLYAFSSDLSTDYYDSTMCTGGVDQMTEGGTKFSVPTIANGYVYVGTQSNFYIYGLISNKPTC